MSISVIIVNFNGVHHLKECLSSLEQQTFRDFEVLLVDNGSTDGSVAFITRYFPGVTIVALQRNTGFCEGNRIGLRHTSGRYIALLNNDTTVEPGWLEALYTVMQRSSGIGLCASRMVNYHTPGVLDTAGDGFDICGVGFKTGEGRPVAEYRTSQPVFGACAGAALYRRSMLDEIGFFDNRFFAYGEDLDLSFRAKLAGYQCLYVPDAIVFHKINQTVGSDSDFLLYHTRRNIEYTYCKNMPSPLLLLTLPLHLLYNGFTLVQAFHQGRIRVFLKAKTDFLRHLPEILQERKTVQALRRISLLSLMKSFSINYLWLRVKQCR